MRSRIWTVAEAKARLSEVLRLASQEGPQRIGTRKTYVVVSEEMWCRIAEPTPPMGKWILGHFPPATDQDGELDLPDRAEPSREDPFAARFADAGER